MQGWVVNDSWATVVRVHSRNLQQQQQGLKQVCRCHMQGLWEV
jgi:hypothetical protein